MPDGYDYELRRQVRSLQDDINVVNRQINLVGNRVDSVHVLTGEARSELALLRADFDRWRDEAGRTANVQRAETKIGTVRSDLAREFGHHDVVRRSATGLLMAFDEGLVSEETVRTVTEQMMIENPRYWLAPALVALAAWSRSDQICASAPWPRRTSDPPTRQHCCSP